MAAATITRQTVVGDLRYTSGTFAFDSSYPTGGEACSAAALGLTKVDFVQFSPSAGYVFEYDYTASKVKAYDQKDPGNAGGADIALPEVADTTSLSTVAPHWVAFGK